MKVIENLMFFCHFLNHIGFLMNGKLRSTKSAIMNRIQYIPLGPEKVKIGSYKRLCNYLETKELRSVGFSVPFWRPIFICSFSGW
jgi:hypothetical protein